MSFKWADFLNTAEGLLKYPDKEYNEARWRSSISRAYYACHCTASTLLKSEGSNLDKKSFSGDFVGIHNKVIEKFKDSGEEKRQQIGNGLVRLKSYRIKADYYETADFDFKKNAPLVLYFAKDVIANLESL